VTTTLERRSGGSTVGEFARQRAETEIVLLRIRKLKASIFKTVCGNREGELGDFSELNESLGKLGRYDRRAFSRRKHALLATNENDLRYYNTHP
jgi:hypothetical protein